MFILPVRISPGLEDKSAIAGETFPSPSSTFISSGRSGKGMKLIRRPRGSIQCKDSGQLPDIACCNWNSDLSYTTGEFSQAIFPNATSHNHCKDLPLNDLPG